MQAQRPSLPHSTWTATGLCIVRLYNAAARPEASALETLSRITARRGMPSTTFLRISSHLPISHGD